MKSLTKELLIAVVIFLALVEAMALWLPNMEVISSVVRDYRLETFSVPFVLSILVSHFFITIMPKKWWNPFVWVTAIAAVICIDFLTTWEPANSGYVVLAGLITGLFWSQKKDK